MRKHLPKAELFIGKELNQLPGYVIQQHIASGLNGHMYRAYNSSTEQNLAVKFVPVQNLPKNEGQQEIYLNEARKANQLYHQSVVKYFNVFPYENSALNIIGVIFVCDFIKGYDLRKHIKERGEDVNIPFVETFLRTMFELLYELKGRKVQHGDLHAGNVLVETSEYDIYGRPTFRVTDFGVRELTEPTQHLSDYLHVAEILKQLLDKVRYTDCEGRDRFVYEVLRKDFLARHLIETDTTADPLAENPQGLLQKLQELDDQYLAAKGAPASKLLSPFDYPNCEQIGNSHLLLKSLYSDRLLGLSEIQERSNLILTGPRGCGKTTVFRALSLEYLEAIS